ncbi:MAG: hypothetical protein IJT20_07510 [Synergistaceae bacterium]|nr:hypothetical protein [Synergistaceae bacterium]
MKKKDIIIEIFGGLFEKDKEKAVADAHKRVATDMLKKKLPISLIEEISKLSEAEIRAIAAKIGVPLSASKKIPNS